MRKLKAKFSIWLANTVTVLAGKTGWKWLIRLMRRLTGTQLAVSQIIAVRNAVRGHEACRLLVFGVGNDSRFWKAANPNGRTVFLEDDAYWLQRVRKRLADMEAYLVQYDSRIEEWKALIDRPEQLKMELPAELEDGTWDVILVDAPAGWGEGTPGRMKSIYTSMMLVGPHGDVFVHDCHREVEAAYCDRFLGPDNLVQEIMADDVGHLRHYRPRT